MLKSVAVFALSLFIYSLPCKNVQEPNSISKIEMHLSAFGVESDDFPSIDAYVDFVHDSSSCSKWYYNPAHKSSTYYLSHEEIRKVLDLVRDSDLKKLQREYRVEKTDQPTSTIVIYNEQEKLVIKDYGLEGEYPLQELYKLVYKL